jgi:apolipoprotein N-acyltransferase
MDHHGPDPSSRWATRARRLWPSPGSWRAAALSLVGAGAAGFVLLLSFPPYDLWFLAPVGVAMLALTTYRRGFWAGALLGFVTGVTLMIPLLSWAGGFVGSVWLFLPFGESAYFALLGGLSGLVTPVLARWRWSWPLVVGMLWVLQEALRDRTPFGGFPWGRLAFSQADSPLLGFAALGGAPLVTFAVAACGGLLALAVRVVLEAPRPYQWQPVRPAAAALAATLAIIVVPLPMRPSTPDDAVAVRVAIVQGNVPRLGLDFNAQRRAVLDNHVNATLDLARRVDAGQTPAPDLVIWPENSSDIDPITNRDAGILISRAAQAIGVPILVGALREGPGPMDVRNVGLVWDPQDGPAEGYVKRHPVPFAEYMPMRSFIREYITEKVDLVRRDFVAGEVPGVLTLGPATIGNVICFEVAYDEIVRDTVTGGAGLLVVQTNNATFNEAEALQQLAMVRLRAVEHGREALMASTVGVSAFVDAHGSVFEATQFFEAAVIERDMRLRTGRTIATTVGMAPEVALVLGALGLVVLAVVLRFRQSAQVRASRRGGLPNAQNGTGSTDPAGLVAVGTSVRV